MKKKGRGTGPSPSEPLKKGRGLNSKPRVVLRAVLAGSKKTTRMTERVEAEMEMPLASLFPGGSSTKV